MERAWNLSKVTQLESMAEPRLILRAPPIATVRHCLYLYPIQRVAYVDHVLTVSYNQEPALD